MDWLRLISIRLSLFRFSQLFWCCSLYQLTALNSVKTALSAIITTPALICAIYKMVYQLGIRLAFFQHFILHGNIPFLCVKHLINRALLRGLYAVVNLSTLADPLPAVLMKVSSILGNKRRWQRYGAVMALTKAMYRQITRID